MSFGVTVTGIEDVNHILATIAPREAQLILRNTLAELARNMAKDAMARTPDDTGLLDKSISAKRDRGSKYTPNTVSSSIRVAADAFYWRFLEYGQGPDHVEHAMFLQTLQALRPDLNRKYLEIFTKKLIARLKKLRK